MRPLPGMEALVYADPVGTQVRTRTCPRACPLLCTFPVPSDPVLPASLPLCLQFFARLQSPHHPREPDQRHHLHSAQWPHQDRLWCWRGGAGQGAGLGNLREPRAEIAQCASLLTPALSLCVGHCSVVPHLLQWCVGPLGCGDLGETGLLSPALFRSTS